MNMVTAQQIYESNIRQMTASERLRLATLILDDLTAQSADVLDYSDSWSDEDVQDLAAFSALYAASAYPEDEPIV